MRKNKLLCMLLLIAAIIILQIMPVAASNTTVVAVDQSKILTFSGIQRVAVANPDIADVGVVSGSELLLIGKAPGVTTVHVWTNTGRVSLQVEVGNNDTNIANAIKNTLGYTDIRVSKVNKAIILEGTVNDQYQKLRAEKVASAYGDKVINLLEITRPTQVKIEARIIEIDREKLKNLGVTWGNVDQNGALIPHKFGFGQSRTNIMFGQTLGDLGGYLGINGDVTAKQIDSSIRILSQPNMITISGEKAQIWVGGEIAIPVALDNGKLSVTWKEYGIKLEVNPEVNSEGLINSKINAEVSTLDPNSANSVEIGSGLKIPAIKTRKAETSIALQSGQTMIIGGLIATETSKDITKVPLLGDLPIIGKLFQSSSFRKGETELIIMITPTIVNPATYAPAMTPELKAFAEENPVGGVKNEGKNKSTGR